MGKASREKKERVSLPKVRKVIQPLAPRATHEPPVPINWPDGHVQTKLADLVDKECIIVTIHGIDHYLHATTARELSNKLIDSLNDYNFMVKQTNSSFGIDIPQV